MCATRVPSSAVPDGANLTMGRAGCSLRRNRFPSVTAFTKPDCNGGARMDALVSTDWLEKELNAVDLRVVDATWLMPGEGDAAAAYEQAHIPGAVFMDLAELADTGTSLPNMLPPAEKFASRMQS